jgi:prevent-host-death family protein
MKPKPEATVKVAEIKAHLSAYLREARRGRSVTICDRETPVARLVPVETESALIVRPRSPAYPSLQQVPLPPPLRSATDAVAILLEDRESGR